MLNTVDCLTGADTVGVVGEGQIIGAVGGGRKLSAFCPCELVTVVVVDRVTDGIIGDSRALIRSQQITPVGVTVGIIIGAVQRSRNRGCSAGSSESVGLSILDVTGVIVIKEIRSAGRSVILADELSEVAVPTLVRNDPRSVGDSKDGF